MDDLEVIDAFLEDGSGAVFSPSLNIERGTLKLDGWWSAAFRISGRTVLVRDEDVPADSTVVADLAVALGRRGLVPLGADFPGIVPLTYTILDLGYAPWVLWSTDRAAGEADLNARVTEESFLAGGPASGQMPDPQNTDHARGGRRVAGVATRVLLAVGVDHEVVVALEAGLDDCRIEHRALGEIEPDDCGSLLPTLVLVDATRPAGGRFVLALQLGDSVRAPVVAVTDGGVMWPGADASVDAAARPETWLPVLLGLLG